MSKFLSNIDLNQNQLLNGVIHNVAADPGTGEEGQLIYRTDLDVIKYYDGSSWVAINSGSITSFTLAGDTGTTTIEDLDTMTIDTVGTGLSTAVSGDTLTITLADVPNSELENDSITLTNVDGHLTFANSGVVALGGSIAIETSGLVDDDSNQTIAGDKTFTGSTVFSGNVDINGTLTTIDATNLLVEDALIVLARNQSTGVLDSGIIVERGSDNTVAVLWDESENEWALVDAGSEDGTTSGNVTISDYLDLRVGNLKVDDRLTVTTVDSNASPTEVFVPGTGNVLEKATIADLLNGSAVESLAVSATDPLNLSVDTSTGDVTITGSLDLATDTEARTSSSDAVVLTPGNLRATERAETITGNNVATSFTITHNIGTKDLIIQVYDTSNGCQVHPDITRTSTSVATLDFGKAPLASENYRVLIKSIGTSIN
jgi:hypothetical protein